MYQHHCDLRIILVSRLNNNCKLLYYWILYVRTIYFFISFVQFNELVECIILFNAIRILLIVLFFKRKLILRIKLIWFSTYFYNLIIKTIISRILKRWDKKYKWSMLIYVLLTARTLGNINKTSATFTNYINSFHLQYNNIHVYLRCTLIL